jgi:hypothetical protein
MEIRRSRRTLFAPQGKPALRLALGVALIPSLVRERVAFFFALFVDALHEGFEFW